MLGIRYEYRVFSNFSACFEMGQFDVLGQFWVTWVKNLFLWVTPSSSLGGIFYAFFRRRMSAIHSEALALFSSMMWA